MGQADGWSRQMNDSKRVFRGQVVYTSNGWFAEVYADDGPKPYLFRARVTRWGARRTARRLARKLNRREKQGVLR